MNTCIYCGSEEVNDEHHLPRCFGNFKGYVLVSDRICRRCNNLCGLLDEQLCNSGGESFFRQYLGITGRKSHKKINPFYRGSVGGGRIEMQGINPHTGETVQLELTSKDRGRELRCIRLIADDDSEYVITIRDGMTPAEFYKKVTELEPKHFKTGYVLADQDEIPWIETLVSTLKIEQKTEWSNRSVGPVIYGPIDIKFTVTNRYFRAIAKIGFHYFLSKMKSFRGDEDCFAEIRQLIKKETQIADCERFVTQNKTQIAQELKSGQVLKSWGHILCAEIDYLWLTAKVQLFVGPGYFAPVYNVKLGRNPSRIDFSRALGDFFAYYPTEQRGEFDGEVSELRAIPLWGSP